MLKDRNDFLSTYKKYINTTCLGNGNIYLNNSIYVLMHKFVETRRRIINIFSFSYNIFRIIILFFV